VIERLASGTRLEQRTRDVDHLFARALVDQRRAATAAEAARAAGRPVLIARDLIVALCDAEAFAPNAHVGGVDGAMREPARARVIVASPERRIVDLELDCAAKAMAGDGGGICKLAFHHVRLDR